MSPSGSRGPWQQAGPEGDGDRWRRRPRNSSCGAGRTTLLSRPAPLSLPLLRGRCRDPCAHQSRPAMHACFYARVPEPAGTPHGWSRAVEHTNRSPVRAPCTTKTHTYGQALPTAPCQLHANVARVIVAVICVLPVRARGRSRHGTGRPPRTRVFTSSESEMRTGTA